MLVAGVRQAVTGVVYQKRGTRHCHFRAYRCPACHSPQPCRGLAPDLIARICDQQGKVKMCLEIEVNDDTVGWLVSQSHDFGLTTSVPTKLALAHLPLEQGRVFCVVPQSHRLAAKPEITPKDLNGACFVSYIAGSRFWHDIDQVFEAAGVARELRFETRTSDAICQLVARGTGVSVVATSPAADIPGCVAVPFKAQLDTQAVLIWPKNRTLSAPAKDFLEMVRGDGASPGG